MNKDRNDGGVVASLAMKRPEMGFGAVRMPIDC